MGKVYNLCRVKTDRSAVLTVKGGLDPDTIIKLKVGCKSWILCVFGLRCFFKLKWVGMNLLLGNSGKSVTLETSSLMKFVK
jgi:hypothetical protein